MKKALLVTTLILSIGCLIGCSNKCEHNLVIDSKVFPTCESTGLTEGAHCSKCNEVFIKQEVIPAKGHTIVDDEAVDPTCTHEGKSHGQHCSECEKVIEEQKIIPAKGHTVVIDKAVDATCTTDGLTEGKHCSTCGLILVKQNIIPRTGHSLVIDKRIDPTCTTDGVTEGIHCSTCHEILKQQEVIPAPGHTIVTDSAKEATCIEDGCTEGKHCATCGEIIIPQTVIPKLGHSYVTDEAIEPTCSHEGKTMGLHCSRCHEVFIEQKCIDKLPHTKGALVELPVEEIEGVKDPGLFECAICGEHFFDSVSHEDIGLPVLDIEGDLSGMSKTVKKTVKVNYSDENQSFNSFATLKWQGGSSVSYPKKNYNIQFFKDEELTTKNKFKLKDTWGKESKYTLKANYVDFSELRNVVSAQIYGDIVHSRHINDQYDALVNGGAIDGYPILIFQNGVYQGLYTLNIPKDDWLFQMDGDSTTREAILMANDWSDSPKLKEPMNEDFSNGWELEYASTEKDETVGTKWVSESFNKMIKFINENDGEDFKNGISQYVNVPRVIDSMLYTWVLHATDNTSKNIVWTTYDGNIWSPSVYDLDGTWGLHWSGSSFFGTNAYAPYTANVLWQKIYANNYDDVIERYKEIRNGALSLNNIDSKIISLFQSIPGNLYSCETKKWSSVPSQDKNHITQIVNWSNKKLISMDNYFKASISESLPFNISFSCDEHCYVKTFINSNYSLKSDETTSSLTRNGDTGLITNNDGQTNFEIILEDGYKIDSIEISGTYKNLKTPKDTGRANTYRITKIGSDLTVVIKTSLL